MKKFLVILSLAFCQSVAADGVFSDPPAKVKWDPIGNYGLCHLTFSDASKVNIKVIPTVCKSNSSGWGDIYRVYFDHQTSVRTSGNWKEVEKFAARYCMQSDQRDIYINAEGGTGICDIYVKRD